MATVYQHLDVSQSGRVLTVAFNQPEARNAIDAGVHGDLERLFPEAAQDSSIGAIVLTGRGEAFSAGGKIAQMREAIEQPKLFYSALTSAKRLVFAMLDCPTPIIARINGDAIGLGATIALLCDITIADETVRIGDPHVKLGFVAGDGGALIWPLLIGYARAKQYLLTGDLLTGREAAEIGLINFAVPAGELDALTDKWAARLSGGAQRAVNWTKMSINVGLRQLGAAVMEAGMAYEVLSNATDDHREAVTAMEERRKPSFGGD